MAKTPKRTTIADSKPPPSTADDWMPLIAAFLHIQEVVGGEELAEEELRQRIASADIEVQDRRVSPGVGIDIIPLKPEDCVGPYGLLFPRLHENISDLHREAHRRDNLLRRVERLRFHGHNFFLRGADLYRIWPIAGHADQRSPRMPRRMDSAEKPQLVLPPKVKKSADTVLALTRQGYTWGWSEREALLTKVRELTGDKSLHISTLKRALRHLRDQGLITKSGIATLVPTGSEPT
jgi:hypothetical protein